MSAPFFTASIIQLFPPAACSPTIAIPSVTSKTELPTQSVCSPVLSVRVKTANCSLNYLVAHFVGLLSIYKVRVSLFSFKAIESFLSVMWSFFSCLVCWKCFSSYFIHGLIIFGPCCRAISSSSSRCWFFPIASFSLGLFVLLCFLILRPVCSTSQLFILSNQYNFSYFPSHFSTTNSKPQALTKKTDTLYIKDED